MLTSLLSRRRFGGGLFAAGATAPLLAACGGNTTPPQTHVAGAPATTHQGILDAGAAVLQSRPPVDALNMYLDGFHFYADDMGRQVEAHHYCTALNADVHQCVIYDSNGDRARLIGVEYIISERLFRDLPEEEKPLWHSHRHEVKSGLLVMPGIPGAVERDAMGMLVNTYGKTWHTWQVDRGDALPLGPPQLMMGFTADGQVDAALVRARDARFGISSADKREDRASLRAAEVAPGADSWRTGTVPQVTLRRTSVRNR